MVLGGVGRLTELPGRRWADRCRARLGLVASCDVILVASVLRDEEGRRLGVRGASGLGVWYLWGSG